MIGRRTLAGTATGLLLAASAAAVAADKGAPLFINVTTDDPHRARMALTFGARQQERGHPLTIFLNDRGVNLGAAPNGEGFADHQKVLAAIVAAGGQVLVCQMCMEHFGVAAADLVPGLAIGSPDVTGAALFAADTRTLTW